MPRLALAGPKRPFCSLRSSVLMETMQRSSSTIMVVIAGKLSNIDGQPYERPFSELRGRWLGDASSDDEGVSAPAKRTVWS
jgi:hypothetical protein